MPPFWRTFYYFDAILEQHVFFTKNTWPRRRQRRRCRTRRLQCRRAVSCAGRSASCSDTASRPEVSHRRPAVANLCPRVPVLRSHGHRDRDRALEALEIDGSDRRSLTASARASAPSGVYSARHRRLPSPSQPSYSGQWWAARLSFPELPSRRGALPKPLVAHGSEW
jgi:hypothetical protein